MIAQPIMTTLNNGCSQCGGIGYSDGHLCSACHGKPSEFIPMRRWQSEGIKAWRTWMFGRKSGDSRTFTAAVSGGAGKTYFGGFVAKECEPKRVDRVIVVAPSNTIVDQWLRTLNNLPLKRDTVKWDGSYENGVNNGLNLVTTYAMMSNNAHRLKRATGSDTLIIFDECHHLADSAAWGEAAKEIASPAAYRLMLTATAFREDDAKIPLVTYRGGLLQTNFEYSYGEALNDGYVRPVYFKALDADSHWKIDSNLSNARLLADDNSSVAEQKALNAALDPNSDFMHTLIGMAHQQLVTIRKRPESTNAAGIITCKDQQHARQVLRVMQKLTHTNPVLVISDDADSDAKLKHFHDSDDAWLVVVRKGSEGLDIPRLRVGIYATNITTELYFIQFLMRLIRQGEQGKKEDAYLFMPAHRKLIEYANNIREMRVHALKEVPVIESSKSELTREKGETKVTTPIAAEAGETVEIDIEQILRPSSSPLEMLIHIRELAAKTIDDVARGYNQPHSESDIVLDTLSNIAELLSVQVAAPVPNVQPNLTPAQEFERKRQWKAFKELFYQLQKMPNWYRDVLSYLWNNVDDSEKIKGGELALKCNFPVERVTSNYKRDFQPLVETQLVATEIIGQTRVYQPYMHQHLSQICPDYDSEELMGYLLTGKLPEEQP